MKLYTKLKKRLIKYGHSFSHVGLFVGTIFFAYSMTPSLLPRLPILQGLLAGVVFAVGYGLGVFGVTIWKYFELNELKGKWRRHACKTIHIIGLFAVVYTIFNWRMWQNSILYVMEQPIMDGHGFVLIVMVFSLIAGTLLIALGRFIGKSFQKMMKYTHSIIPRRISRFVGFLIMSVLIVGILNGVIIRVVYDFTDNMYGNINNLTDDGAEQPSDPMKVGSENSLINWDTLGKAGRNFISVGPSADDISSFTGREAREPIRVYAGLQSAETYDDRAQLVFDEMLRVGAFDRSVLIITTPTGTGWMDPYAIDTIEYLHDGDTANVSMQHSYLSSQATLVFNPERAGLSAEALFDKVYSHWTTLPEDSRPKLYLFGISLGSFGSEQSAQLYQIMYDPIDGALWAGPPFANQIHQNLVSNRNSDSPYWLPTYDDGSLVRFTSSINNLDNYTKDWQDMRLIYLQYASDPMVFFSPTLFAHKPEWLNSPFGNDVSPMLSWHPVVTFFQIAFDMIVSVSGAPLGHGHNYSPVDYIDSWIELTDPENWSEEKVTELKELFLN